MSKHKKSPEQTVSPYFPKTIHVKIEPDSDGTVFLVADQTIPGLNPDHGQSVARYELVEEGSVQISMTVKRK